MSTVHRICAACGEDVPLQAQHCPYCGHDTQSGLPMKTNSNLPMVVGKAAVPMLVTAGTLAARLIWRLVRARGLPTATAALEVQETPAPQRIMRSEPQPIAARSRRSIHIRSTWAVGDANGVWRRGMSEQHIDIEE